MLAAGLLLCALGSLRDVVTPLGYWALWGAWILAAAAIGRPARVLAARRWRALYPIWASFAVLVLGMGLAAAVNGSPLTLHHGIKIAVIALCCWVAWTLVARCSWLQRITALRWTTLALVLVFLGSKAAPAGYYIQLGADGREGSFLAWPGVLWKAGAFFLPLFLADVIARPAHALRSGLAAAACVFLVMVDGSRTGVLGVGLVLAGFGAMVAWRRDWAALWRARRGVVSGIAALVLLLFVSTGIGIAAGHAPGLSLPTFSLGGQTSQGTGGSGPGVGTAAGSGAESSLEDAEAFVDAAVEPLTSTRLGSGDPQRMRLLRNGLARARACLPLGCGFGSTAIDPGYGIPMVVHNAYVGALADFGLLGLAGMLGFILAAALPLWRVLRRGRGAAPASAYFIAGSAGSALLYLGGLMLHTFSSEMSEWGYLVFMLAFAWLPARDA